MTGTGDKFHADSGTSGPYDGIGWIAPLTLCGKRIVAGYIPPTAEVDCAACLKKMKAGS